MKAFAPGSVTTVFTPPGEGADRSKGVSVAIEDGVVVTVKDGEGVTVDNEPAPFSPIEHLLSELGVTARVDVSPSVPLGCGFGASGAATLATALAANECFDLGLSRENLVKNSHQAEVAARTGLGDVFIQDRGGIVTSTGADMDRTTSDERIEYVSFGSIATSDVLDDKTTMEHIRRKGEAVLGRLPAEATLDALFTLAWEFAQETRLVTDSVKREVLAIQEANGTATMAMVGETVVAAGVEGALPNVTRVSNRGAQLL